MTFSGRNRTLVWSITLVVATWCSGPVWSQTSPKATPRPPPPAPDPSIFDGTDFPPEERPERGLLADFEAGEQEPSQEAEEQENPGGAEEQEEGGGSGSLAGAGGGQEGTQGSNGSGSGDDGDAAGGQENPGGVQAPKVAAMEDQPLVKPGEIPLGDPNARIAQTPEALRQPPAGAQVSNQQGEDRMSVKSATGQQTPSRSRGSERGIEIPSSL